MIIQRASSKKVWEQYRHEAELIQFKSMIAPLVLELARKEAANGDDDKAQNLLDLLNLIEEHDLMVSPVFVARKIHEILRPEI